MPEKRTDRRFPRYTSGWAAAGDGALRLLFRWALGDINQDDAKRCMIGKPLEIDIPSGPGSFPAPH